MKHGEELQTSYKVGWLDYTSRCVVMLYIFYMIMLYMSAFVSCRGRHSDRLAKARLDLPGGIHKGLQDLVRDLGFVLKMDTAGQGKASYLKEIVIPPGRS